MALFVKHDVTLLDTERIVVASMAVRGCAWTADLLAKRTEDDGWFLRALLLREGATSTLIDETIAAGLLEADGARLRPVGWLDRNPSQAAIAAKRDARALAGIKGNHERWHAGPFESCTPCQAKKAEVIASSDSGAIAPVSQPDPISSPESELEAEYEPDRPPSQRATHPGFAGPKPVEKLAEVKNLLGREVSA